MSISSDFVSVAMKHEPLSVSHSIGFGNCVDATEAVPDGGDDKVLNVFAFDPFSGGDMRHLALAPSTVSLNSQLFLPVAKILISRSSKLLSIGILPSSV